MIFYLKGVLDMKNMKVLSVVILAVFVFSVPAYAKELKLGYVNLQRALMESDAGKAAREKLKKDAEVKETELTEQQTELKALNDDIEKKADVWNEETRRAKEIELRKKGQEFQDKYVQYEQELNLKEKETIEEIIKGLSVTVKDIARKDGYDYIFEKAAGGILVAPDGDDLTDKVIESFDKSSKK